MGSAMWYFALSVLVGFSSAMVLEGIENIDDGFEPQVAFKCGFASNYLTRSGWQVDQSRSCLSNAEDIMAYCKLKYPKLQVTNVIPSPSEIEANLTVLNGSSVEKLKLRPYRCIVGEFDSDALVVPDGCSYGTSLLSNSTQCASYFEWNSTAHERCAADLSELFSFGVVRPCGVGTFHYMEFVCCPPASVNIPNPTVEPPRKSQPAPKSTRPQVQRSTQQPAVTATSWEYDIDYVYEEDQLNDWYEVSAVSEMADDDEYDDGYQYDEYFNEEGEPYEQEFEDDLQYEDDTDDYLEDDFVDSIYTYDDIDYDPTKNYFQIYMDTPKLLGNTENEIYAKALRLVKRYYDSQKQLLLQQLAEAELRVTDSNNASAAQEALAADIVIIRELYEKTEKTWNGVKNSMLEEHNKRTVKDLQSERETQSEAWKNVVRLLKPNATFDDLTQLLSVLRRYINTEEKERIFWLNQYETLLNTDSEAAIKVRLVVKNSLRAIKQRLIAVIESLKRDGVAKTVVDSVEAMMSDYLSNFTELDLEVQMLFPDLDSSTESSTTDELLAVTDDEGRKNDLASSDDEDAVAVQLSDADESRVEEKPVMLIVMVSAGAFVLTLVFVSAIVLVCSLRKRRNMQHNTNGRIRRHAASLHHALFIPGATKHGSLEPLHLDSGSHRILVDVPPSPRQSVYAQTTRSGERRIRGHDNPLNNFAGITFSDSAPLVEHDVLNEDSKRVA